MRKAATIPLLLLAAGAPALAAPPVDELIAYLIHGLGATQSRCAGETDGDGHAVCAHYTGGFSSFKADWEQVMRHAKLPTPLSSDRGWIVRGRGYRGVFEHYAGEPPLTVDYEPKTGELRFTHPWTDEERPAAASASAATRKVKDVRIAGFGGVTMPALREESRVEPLRPFRAQAERVVGRVTLEVVVSAQGYVLEAEVLREEPPGYGFGDAAREAVARWEFEPATFEGEPVAARRTLRVDVREDPPPPGETTTPEEP